MSNPYGPNNPHPFDDPHKQVANPGYPGQGYPSVDAQVNPEHYERMPGGQQQYYADRQAAAAFARDQLTPKVPGVPAMEQSPQMQPFGPEYRMSASLPITVNYDLPVQEMIEAGHYAIDGISQATLRNLQAQGNGIKEIDIGLISFAWPIPFSDQLILFENFNLRPAGIAELLALGANYPNLQRSAPIVASSAVNLCLDRDSVTAKRTLRVLSPYGTRAEGVFFANVHFAVILNSTSEETLNNDNQPKPSRRFPRRPISG